MAEELIRPILCGVISLSADFLTPEQAVKLVMIWLNAQFKGGRYQERLSMIDKWSGL